MIYFGDFGDRVNKNSRTYLNIRASSFDDRGDIWPLDVAVTLSWNSLSVGHVTKPKTEVALAVHAYKGRFLT